MHIIGIKGLKDSGKSTVANYLKNNYSFDEDFFSKDVKNVAVIITGWSYEYLNGETPEYKHLRETVKHPDYGLTGREILQKIGTDLFRNNFDKDTWVKITKRRIKNQNSQRIIFSDLRFENECNMVQDIGGIIIKLNRNTNHNDTHESEQLFNTFGEIIVDNNGTLEELYKKIDKICLDNKI